VQNVVTYDTVIEFDNPDRKLFPGMTAYVTIPVARADDVLKIPNSALRFKPDMKPDEIRALYQKYGIQMESRRGQQGELAQAENPPPGAQPPAADANGAETRGGGTERPAQAAGNRGDWQQRRAARMQPTGASQPAPAQNEASAQRAQTAVVWKLLPDKSIQPVQIRTGITDYTVTALASGDLKEGDQLVTGSQSTRTGSNPFQQQRPGGAGRGPR
jgi:HlyD family secretion protein